MMAIQIALVATVFLIPFLPDMLTLLLLYALLGLYLGNDVVNKHNPLTKSKMDLPIILYALIIVISTVTSINFRGSLRDLSLHLAGLCFVFVMANNVKTKEAFHVIASMLVYTATLVALYGLYQYVVGVEIDKAWVDVNNNPDLTVRVYSVFYNPNILAEYLVLIIPISLALCWQSRKLFKKFIFFGCSLVMILSLVLTQSRGGWLGFAMSVLVFILLIERKLLYAMIPVGIGALYFLPDSIMNRIMSIGNLADSSNAYRIKIWEITMDIIQDYPIAGVGFGHLPFKQTFETYIRTMPTYHAHNTYLETAAELGIPGLILFLFFLFVLFKYGIIQLVKTGDRYIRLLGAGVIAGLAGFLTHGVVENVLYIPRIIFMFWVLIAFILTLVRIKELPES